MKKWLSKIFPQLFKYDEPFDELIIRWADTIVLKSDYTGKLDRRSFKLDWVYEPTPTTIDEVNEWANAPDRAIRESVIVGQTDPIETTKFLIPYLEAVKFHLLSNDYISSKEVVNQEWVLTERGKLMKELGGHKNFIAHRKWEIHAVRSQWRINAGLLLVTGLAILVPFISEWIKTSKTSNKRGEYPPLVVHYDSLQIRSIVEDILKNKESMMKKEAGKIDTIPK